MKYRVILTIRARNNFDAAYLWYRKQSSGDFVATRLLESGSWQSILWLCRAAGGDALQQLVRQRGGRGLSRGQLRFWQIRWGLPKRLVDQWLKRGVHRFDLDAAASRRSQLVER